MNMTLEEKILAYKMHVFDKFTWRQIARVLFQEACETAPDLSALFLKQTVAYWYKTDKNAPKLCWESDGAKVVER